MKLSSDFTLVNVVDDYMLVPIGDKIADFHGTVVLNEVSAFMIENLEKCTNVEQLIKLITEEYDVDYEIAENDVKKSLEHFLKLGVIED